MGLIILGLNKFIGLVGSSLTALLAILPNTPFTWDTSTIDNFYLSILFWLVPVQSMVVVLVNFAAATAVYYGIRTVLRWAKVAGQ